MLQKLLGFPFTSGFSKLLRASYIYRGQTNGLAQSLPEPGFRASVYWKSGNNRLDIDVAVRALPPSNFLECLLSRECRIPRASSHVWSCIKCGSFLLHHMQGFHLSWAPMFELMIRKLLARLSFCTFQRVI